MARYIDLDEAIKYLHNDCKAKYPLCYANGLSASINELGKLPAADVVPKSEQENYKELYEQLLNDFEQALYFAEKSNSVCNFCENDCGEGGACKGREKRWECSPKWRGVIRTHAADDE